MSSPNPPRVRKEVRKKFRGSKEEGKDKHTVTPKTVTHPKFTKKKMLKLTRKRILPACSWAQ